MRDLDEEYDELMYELEAAMHQADAPERAARIQDVRRRIEDLLRQQVGLAPRLPSRDWRHGPYALN